MSATTPEAAGEVASAGSAVRVHGEPYAELPRDLYIPPDALEVFLEAFEGPLDLLLYLIRRQNLDIRDIPIAEITRQYMAYVEVMRELRLELAAQYLVMASLLAEIKSRMLLPRPPKGETEEEEDPRAELIRRLEEYERFKGAGEELAALPRVGRDLYQARAAAEVSIARPPAEVGLSELLEALATALRRAENYSHHRVRREALSVRARMAETLVALSQEYFTGLDELLGSAEGRAGVVVTFLALLELLKDHAVEVVQTQPFEPIYVRAKGDGQRDPADVASAADG